MSIQSLGVGSGLALDDLVSQLIQAEREPEDNRLNAREESADAEISALGTLTSKLEEFEEALDDLRSDNDLNGREPTVTNPSEDTQVLTAEASNSALEGTYDIAVSQLASGSRIETNNTDAGTLPGFAASTDSILSSGSGSLTFKVGTTSDTFTVNVSAGMTLAQLREAINSNENNFGVNANLIETGTTSGGVKLVITSDVTGAGNDLSIVNDNDLADLQRIATTDSTETSTFLNPVLSAANAIATVDGIEVQSSSNEFNNTIQNVSFTAETISPLDTDGVTRQTTRLQIGNDREGLDEKIRAFVENYNGLIDELDRLSRFGESELEDDGALAGDALVRSIRSGLASIVGDSVNTSAVGSLFQIGVELNSDGKLEIGSTDFGLGTGESRLDDALDDNFDGVAELFTNSTNGIAVRLYDFVDQYTQSRGLLDLREQAAEDEKDEIANARESLELRIFSYESLLRERYTNLDLTVARLSQTGAALLASLGG